MNDTQTPFAAPADYPRWAEIATLIRHSFAYMAPMLGHPARAASLTAEDLARAAAQGTALLIEAGDAPVACLFTRPSRDFDDALYCGWLAVADPHRGRGLSGQLFGAAESLATTQGYRALTLDTGRPLTHLHRLFARQGFLPAGGDGDIARFRKPLPQRLSPGDPSLASVLDLMQTAFAYMEGRIDPPSSLTRTGLATLADAARDDELWSLHHDGRPIACMILTGKDDTLYLGKLATAADHRGTGLARRMIDQAARRARDMRLGSITLQTRIELRENHAAFRALGFVQTGTTAHPGFNRPTSLTFTKTL